MVTPNQVSIVVTISLLWFLGYASQTKAASDLVETICRETINDTKCIEVFESDSRTKSAKNLNNLAKISLKLAISNARESQAFIKQMLLKNDNRNSYTTPIKQCVFWYNAAVASFRSALSELSEDAMSAKYDAKTAGDSADYCENELALKGILVSSISVRNDQLKLFSNIGYVITNKL